MTEALITTIVSTAGSVIVGLAAIGSNTFWITRALDKIDTRINRLEDRMNTQFDTINGKLSALDTEVAKLMDKTK